MAAPLPDPFVLLEGSFPSAGAGPAFYSEPIHKIRADLPGEVPGALAAIDAAQAAGRHVAGFMAYELGYALEPRLAPLMPERRGAPLIWMGVFETAGAPPAPHAGVIQPPLEFEPNISAEDYTCGIERILEYIRAGDIYQVNYTLALGFDRHGDPLALYAALKRNQPVAYPAAIGFGGEMILSLSPELFFRIENGVITSRPMKGTAPRAPTLE